jgi:hypothetical protein
MWIEFANACFADLNQIRQTKVHETTQTKQHTDKAMKNKHHIIQSVKVAILALVALPLVALQTAAAADTEPEGDNAIMCDKCKTVWVTRPATSPASKGGAPYTSYRKVKTMECKDCESAVATFFKTGKLQHECKACGSELTHCKAH